MAETCKKSRVIEGQALMSKIKTFATCLGCIVAVSLNHLEAAADPKIKIKLLSCKATNFYSPNKNGSMNPNDAIASSRINYEKFTADLDHGNVWHTGGISQKYIVSEFTDGRDVRHIFFDVDYSGPASLRPDDFYRIDISDNGEDIFFLRFFTSDITTGKCKALS